MKHYLDLISISAKVHRRQSWMTRLCIVFAVFLVTVIFSMADMELQAQRLQEIRANGAWHAGFRELSEEQAALIASRPETTCVSWYAAVNYGLNEGYTVGGTETAICGFDRSFLELMPFQKIVEGEFPQDGESVVCTKSVKERLGVKVGDAIDLETPDGRRTYRISGFTGDTSMLTRNDAFGIFLNMDGLKALVGEESWREESVFYVQFTQQCRIQKTIDAICGSLGIEPKRVMQNTKLLALSFQSGDSYMVKLYMTAAVLALLVAAAGIFMISASLNSNIVQRTEFFGMLRCLGATKKQVRRFVRREALSWCRTAVPTGAAAAVAVVWALCAVLRFLSPGLFQEMPRFGISAPGLAAGFLIGLLTVLAASRAPAKMASGVSPLAAVSGNAGTVHAVGKRFGELQGNTAASDTKRFGGVRRRTAASDKRKNDGRLSRRSAAYTRIFHVDTTLGVHHATGGKKNLFLMAGSFAFSIILFLAFSTAIDFMNHAITTLQPYAPDVTVSSPELTCDLPPEVSAEIEALPSVKRAFGRQYVPEVRVTVVGKETAALLLSYEKYQFACAEEMLLEGGLADAESGAGFLTVYDGENGLELGTEIAVTLAGSDGKEKEGHENQISSSDAVFSISGVLSRSPYAVGSELPVLICSESLFRKITGEDGYAVIDVQMTADASDADVETIRSIAGGADLSDRRKSNAEARGAYYSFALFLYGFLFIIALITVFNIVNSISMSVSARMKEYGAMRAVGMSERQLMRMVAAEAATYGALGILLGCALGLPVNRLLFGFLVTERWGDAWSVPAAELLIIIAVVLLSLVLAVWGPSRRIREMSVVDTIAAQ